MRYVMGLMLLLMAGGCTNVAQMQKRYEAGDESQLAKLAEIAGRLDYPYATRRKAARALGEIGDPRAVPVLTDLLYEYEQRITLKQEALIALGRIGDPQAVEPIGRMLDFQLNDNNADLRLAAVDVLGDLGGTRAAEILVNALRYYDLLMLRDEQQAYRGIFSGEEQINPFAIGRGDTTRTGRRGPMLGMYPEEQGQIMSMFGTPMEFSGEMYNPTPEERQRTHAALVRVGKPAVPVIAAFLESQETTQALKQELAGIIEEIRTLEGGASVGEGRMDSTGTGSAEQP